MAPSPALALVLSLPAAGSQAPPQDGADARLVEQAGELAELRARVDDLAARPTSGYDGGFFLQSADGAYRFVLEGLLQVRATVFEQDLEDRTDQFTLERMRLEFGAELDRRWLFHIEPKFSQDDVELEEAWVGARLAPDAKLLAGRMKEPFSLEEMLPRRHFDFPTFSLLNQLVPAEDHGLTLLGGSLDSSVEWGAAAYNGTGGDDTNDDKDVAGRVVFRPWAGDEASALRRLQFGGAVTWGVAEQSIEGDELLTEAKAPFLAFEEGSALDGERVRAGIEAAWLDGPFGVFGEAIHVEEEAAGGDGDVDVAYDGWYVAASWVLTGEEKTFRGVQPAQPFGGEAGGSGALQLVARWSRLELDQDLVTGGLVAAESFPGRVDSFVLGLNWYATAHVKLMLDAIHTEYADPIAIDGDVRDAEDALILQLQMQF